MQDIIIIFICFVVGFVLSWIVGGKSKNTEGKYVPNLVIVANTDLKNCKIENEMCYHIHHWMWLLVLMLAYFLINYLLGYKANITYLYIIALYLGASISEYVFYGNDIFNVYQKCYPHCNNE
jgi:hypothetical protein